MAEIPPACLLFHVEQLAGRSNLKNHHMNVKVSGNVTEQIERGIEPWESKELDVDLKALSVEQRKHLASIAGCNNPINARLVEGTIAEFVAYLESKVQAEREKLALHAHHVQNAEAAVREWIATAKPVCSECVIEIGGARISSRRYDFARCGLGYTESAELKSAHQKKWEELTAEVARLNEAEQERIKPEVEDARAAMEEIQARQEAENKARLAKVWAERLSTGYVEIPFERGDRKDWGEPWIAKVSSKNGRKPEYDFSGGSYDLATETLKIDCKPGETIAWGQKNYRKPRKTIHHIKTMEANGRLTA